MLFDAVYMGSEIRFYNFGLNYYLDAILADQGYGDRVTGPERADRVEQHQVASAARQYQLLAGGDLQ